MLYSVPTQMDVRFQSTLPLRGATGWRCLLERSSIISIHAPLAGSDRGSLGRQRSRRTISIHAPLAGSDRRRCSLLLFLRISIHAPLAGSDYIIPKGYHSGADFNPRSPCGERPPYSISFSPYRSISIHAPLAGSDALPARIRCTGPISIHAPLAGSDLRRARFGPLAVPISIHAPLAGSDPGACSPCPPPEYFNPRSPCGERPRDPDSRTGACDFNPRSPCGERHRILLLQRRYPLFQSTLPLRGATLVFRS